MSKGLEALHRIANANNHFKYDTLELIDKDFQIVQQELQEQEKILKVLFENNVDIGLLMNCNTLDEYQYHCSASTLIPQEFDLLRRYYNEQNNKETK